MTPTHYELEFLRQTAQLAVLDASKVSVDSEVLLSILALVQEQSDEIMELEELVSKLEDAVRND